MTKTKNIIDGITCNTYIYNPITDISVEYEPEIHVELLMKKILEVAPMELLFKCKETEEKIKFKIEINGEKRYVSIIDEV